jgi:transmembrane sensor
VNRQIYEEASEWLVELRVGDVDAAARKRLDNWFRTSPEHVRAFLELSTIWEEGADRDLDRDCTIAQLIARAQDGNAIVALSSSSSAGIPTVQRMSLPDPGQLVARRRRRMAGGDRLRFRAFALRLVAALALVSGGVGSFIVYRYYSSIYSTEIGEQRTVQLADGSTVELNARSRIRVHFSDKERDIDLVEGQALFKVAKNPQRPFIVSTAGTRVQAVGTLFDVYSRPQATTVTVIEGRVAVAPLTVTDVVSLQPAPAVLLNDVPKMPSDSGAVLVSAGEQVVATGVRVSQPKRTDVTAVVAWTQRELVFDSTPLAEVVLEFNRYNPKPLIVSDNRLRDFHITGVFSSTDPTSLLQFLRSQPDIQVTEGDTGIRIARR